MYTCKSAKESISDDVISRYVDDWGGVQGRLSVGGGGLPSVEGRSCSTAKLSRSSHGQDVRLAVMWLQQVDSWSPNVNNLMHIDDYLLVIG